MRFADRRALWLQEGTARAAVPGRRTHLKMRGAINEDVEMKEWKTSLKILAQQVRAGVKVESASTCALSVCVCTENCLKKRFFKLSL